MDDLFQMTIIDRLCETRAYASIAQMRDMVRKDLEDLLNTRQGPDDIPVWFKELKCSLASYGLQNIDNVDICSKDELLKLLSDIKSTIQRFEPRLENINVSVISRNESDRAPSPFVLHLRIDAEMQIGTYVDRLVFNTMIQKSGATVLEAFDHA